MSLSKILVILTVPILLLCSGCWALWFSGGVVAGAGAGVAATAYVEGSLQAHLDQNPAEVAKATEKAFVTLGINKVSSNPSALTSEIVGRTSADDRVKVYADAEGNGSKLTIRIGVFGDEAQSMRIYEEIKKNLPPTPATSTGK